MRSIRSGAARLALIAGALGLGLAAVPAAMAHPWDHGGGYYYHDWHHHWHRGWGYGPGYYPPPVVYAPPPPVYYAPPPPVYYAPPVVGFGFSVR